LTGLCLPLAPQTSFIPMMRQNSFRKSWSSKRKQQTEIKTPTTLGHHARGNATIEVYWRFLNRCVRLLSDEHYLQWPQFAQCIAFTHNSATHVGIEPTTPFEVHHGALARNTLASALDDRPSLSEGEELALSAQFAAAVAVSTSAYAQLAKNHDTFVKTETAARLDLKGTTTTFVIGDKVKVRVPPTQAQLMETSRRAKHVTAWHGPCTVIERHGLRRHRRHHQTSIRTRRFQPRPLPRNKAQTQQQCPIQPALQ
jgi:hypothetical protein